MGDDRPAGSVSTLIKTISDIAVSVAALTAYMLAIFGRADIPYAKTTSLLTILATSIVVVNWRWRAIVHKRETQASIPRKSRRKPQRTEPAPKPALFDGLLQPLKRTDPDEYRLPLGRRRVEAGFLFSISLFALVWSGWHMPAVVEEFTHIPELVCSQAERGNHLRVMVAELDQKSGPDLQFGPRIYDALLENQPEGLYDVCRLKEPIEDRTQARQEAQQYKADVVIWGRSGAVYEVYLEAPALDHPHVDISELSSADAASFDFQLREPPHARFFAQFALGELFLLNKQILQAQNTLEDMLANTDPGVIPREHLAKAYFLLGLLYDPGFYPFRIDSGVKRYPEERKALDAYSHAIDLDPTLHAARLNRGFIHARLQMFDEAVDDFTFLIENDNPYKASAYIHRSEFESDPQAALADLNAAIQIDPANGYYYLGLELINQEEYPRAVEAFQKTLEYTPDEYTSYHGLGQAQVLSGDLQAARETYKQMLPYADRNDIDQVIDELREDAEQEPAARADIEELIRQLQAAKVP